jgi:hypothetical protein
MNAFSKGTFDRHALFFACSVVVCVGWGAGAFSTFSRHFFLLQTFRPFSFSTIIHPQQQALAIICS